MKTGARNDIVGTVTSLKEGTVMAQVGVKIDGPIDLTSVLTSDSLHELALKKGDKVRVVVKAIHVLLIKE
jgi:molybdate transport system regulatory protein